MATTKLFYIGERKNPQLNKPYYISYGQLSKTAAKKMGGCIYGSINLTSFDNVVDYENEIIRIKSEGFRISNH